MTRYTLLTSILNRGTGLLLSLGLLLLVFWLMAVAQGPASYAQVAAFLAQPAMKLIYLGLIVAFCYHLIAGIRHLIWDTGHGLSRAQSERSAGLVIGASLLLMGLLTWFFLFVRGAP